MHSPISMAAGTTLGNYVVVEKIGQGGMGAVYLARDQRLDRQVAIKVIAPHLLDSENARKRFRREALAISKLSHPNIEVVYDIGSENGLEFIVLEYIPGISLDERLESGPLPVHEVVSLGKQMLAGLASAHNSGILHRDLKPSNLRVTPDGRLKILDFGLAKSLNAEPDAATETALTSDALLGTVPYMSPEQLRGGAVDQRSDIFAAGAVLYELATGKRPFEGRTQAELIDRILNRAPASPRSIAPEVSAKLDSAITRALSKEVAQRFASAGEFEQTLSGAADSTTSRRGVIIAVVCVLLLFAAFGAWVLLRSPGTAREKAVPTPPVPPQTKAGDSAFAVQLGSEGKPSSVPEANDLYKRALLVLATQSDLPKTRELLEQALRLDPNFAQARAWYGFTALLIVNSGSSADGKWIYAAEKQERKALESDPENARAHSALAAVYFDQSRLPEMLDEIKKSQQYGAEYDTNIWLGLYHQLRGEYEESNKLNEQILQRNEFFLPARITLAENSREVGDYERCLREDNKILDLDPHNMDALASSALCRMDIGDLKAARQLLEQAMKAPAVRSNYQIRLQWALLLASEGKKQEAKRIMNADLLKFLQLFPSYEALPADYYALMGEKQQAIEALERSMQLGDDRSAWFKRDPMLKSIRSEPRFQQLIESIDYRVKHRAPDPVQ